MVDSYEILGVTLTSDLDPRLFRGSKFPFQFELVTREGTLGLKVYFGSSTRVYAGAAHYNDEYERGKRASEMYERSLHDTEEQALAELVSKAEMAVMEALADLDSWNSWALTRCNEVLERSPPAEPPA